jgi:hypothetical protein
LGRSILGFRDRISMGRIVRLVLTPELACDGGKVRFAAHCRPRSVLEGPIDP